jgi:hypothetical protein
MGGKMGRAQKSSVMRIILSAVLCEFFAFSAVNFFSFNRREPQSFYAEGRGEEICELCVSVVKTH